ncbi:MAG TPA: dihydrolipoyl dehydrogenase, partial [Alphaproteobacteria bacterium]|nr:dihydrolipoyl dehydrogenase [Alphaproteobacteria bacterium]
LLHSSEIYAHIPALAEMGIAAGSVSLDLAAMMGHKDKTVDELTKGIAFLFKKNKVTPISGTAKITAPGTVQVALNEGGDTTLTAANIVVATGS